jgi:hypothetical protein
MGFEILNRQSHRNRNNNFNTSTAERLSNLITPVRVLSIVLDETHPLFSKLGGWNALGAIQYELVAEPQIRPFAESDESSSIAFPATPNLKNYPLINEVVYIISFPNPGIEGVERKTVSYYLNLTSLWNHPHHNAYPSNANESSPPQQKDYLQTTAGSVITALNDPTQIILGKTFKERSDIHPILPFEGDVIHEGRWGNSIRLGSTVKNRGNNWSKVGDDGDPLTIIRNGQGSQTSEGWIPTVENINNDSSSIYLASTQNIPLVISSIREYKSYTNGQQPTLPDQYAGNQIILNSGRLVFNSNNDHILLSSAKTINLNSEESVNIDTKKFITQADKIFLGNEEQAKEPLLLGDTTVNLLKDLLDALKSLSDTLKTATGKTQSGPAILDSLNLAGVTLSTQLTILEKQLSTITSKRNFTV